MFNDDLNNSTKIGKEHEIKLQEEMYLKIEKLIKANENKNSKNMELKLNNNFNNLNEEYNKLFFVKVS